MNSGKFWKPAEVAALQDAYKNKPVTQKPYAFCREYAEKHGYTTEQVRGKVFQIREGRIKESSYPVYDSPLEMEGDAVVITDLELPFHHADFTNRVLDLAEAWGIGNLILGGDALHMDSFSSWEPAWSEIKPGGLADGDAQKLMEFVKRLPKNKQAEGMELLADLGSKEEKDGASTELTIARREIRRLADQFDHIDFVLGNHEGRLLRTIETALSPNELFRLLEINDNPKWRIAPYYYSTLISGGEKFYIEHPKNSGKTSAWKLASKLGAHVLMGHNHHVVFQFDISGRYYAIEIGHCVDEERLPYAAQRHNASHAHSLGACIVREGIPWLLHPRVDWKALASL